MCSHKKRLKGGEGPCHVDIWWKELQAEKLASAKILSRNMPDVSGIAGVQCGWRRTNEWKGK